MPWDLIHLNDGNTIPRIAYGTGSLGTGQSAIDYVDQAISAGYEHIDTAQSYRNEKEAGNAFRESGLARDDVFITTKYSGVNGLDIETSIQNSLTNLGVKYVDLYLIHHPRFAVPDIPTAWAKLEKIKNDGLAKSIGVSNFDVDQLKTLLDSAKIKPAVNQIRFHPYVLEQKAPIVEYGRRNGIVSEAYSALTPLNRQPGGPVDAPVDAIAERLNAEPEQVLLAWVKAKHLVAVTSSRKKERLASYLDAGNLELTDDDIKAIDAAGIIGGRGITTRTYLRRVAVAVLAGAAMLAAYSYLGMNII